MVLNTLIVDVESETLLNKERKPKSLVSGRIRTAISSNR